MFYTHRESCTVSRTKMRGQMKIQRRNAPSVCQSWRRGRMSGKWPLPGCLPGLLLTVWVCSMMLCWACLRACDFRHEGCQVWLFHFAILPGDCSPKPKGLITSRKPPEYLKMTGLMELSLAHTQLSAKGFLPSAGGKWFLPFHEKVLFHTCIPFPVCSQSVSPDLFVWRFLHTIQLSVLQRYLIANKQAQSLQ